MIKHSCTSEIDSIILLKISQKEKIEGLFILVLKDYLDKGERKPK